MEKAQKWDCPNCQYPNADYISQTVFPLCGGCGKDFDWGEVIDESEVDAVMSDAMEVA